MRTFLCFLVLAALAVTAHADVDVTGKWTGSFTMIGPNGETNEGTALLILKQSGTDIAGTVGPSEDQQFNIQKGKIEGDKITLEADHGGHIMKISLVLADDRIKGEAHLDAEGQVLNAKIEVTRAK